MVKGRSMHVVPNLYGGWSVTKAGATRASKNFGTKHEAVKWGREHSRRQGLEFFIHRTDGTVQEMASYGNDPFPSRAEESVRTA